MLEPKVFGVEDVDCAEPNPKLLRVVCCERLVLPLVTLNTAAMGRPTVGPVFSGTLNAASMGRFVVEPVFSGTLNAARMGRRHLKKVCGDSENAPEL